MSITTKVSLVIVYPVSGFKKVESVWMLTNATLITDNAMKTDVKTLMNAAQMVTITGTPGSLVLT